MKLLHEVTLFEMLIGYFSNDEYSFLLKGYYGNILFQSVIKITKNSKWKCSFEGRRVSFYFIWKLSKLFVVYL